MKNIYSVPCEEAKQQRPSVSESLRLRCCWRHDRIRMVLCFLAGVVCVSAVTYGQVSEVSLEFDGFAAYIQTNAKAADLGIAGDAAKSIEAWVYARSFNHSGVFSLGKIGSAGECFGLRTRDTTDQWRIDCGGNNYDIDFAYPGPNRWTHFALVHTGSELIVYADGNEVVRHVRRLKTSANEPFRIGRFGDSTFDGKIAEVRIWNRAISELEIKAYLYIPLDGEEEGIVGYWPLNEGSGDTVKDPVGGHNGVFKGQPKWTLARPLVTDLTTDEQFSPGRSVTFGPVELRTPRGKPTYQWYLNGKPIEGATESSLSIPEATVDDVGTYHVEVDDARRLTPVASNRVRLAKPDWPMWQYDATRSADTPHELSENLQLQWMRELPKPKPAWPHQWDHRGKLDFDVSYSPVVAEKTIFVPSNITDSVTAYRIDDGAEKWRFYANGPVRLAPAVSRGRVYFVSDDGHLYCVDADTGALVWKFRGGPSDHRLLGNERIISLWPCRGGPAVKDGTVYFAAGIWPLHGIFIYALDANTGDVVWVNDTTSSDFVDLPHGGAEGFGGLAPQGYLAVSENQLVVAGGRTPPAFLDRHTGQFVRASFRAKPAGDYAVHAVGGGGMGKRRNAMLMDRIANVSDRIDGEVFYELAAYDRLFVTTTDGRLYCFGPDEITPRSYAYMAGVLRPRTYDWNVVARELLEQLGESQGYALVLGAGSGDLLRELLVHSEMHVVVVEADADNVRALRDELADSGMYGRRAAVIRAEPASFSIQPYLFSMVVSEDAPAAGIGSDTSVLRTVLNRLRPYGGLAWLGSCSERLPTLSRAASMANVDQVTVQVRGNHLLAMRGGPLSGAGQWTHQYHDAANTLMSTDERVRLPLGLLWYGGPNNHNILPRHAGGPRPQVASGRQVFLGVETIAARCVYTGRPIWERRFPGIGHAFTDLELEARWRQGEAVYMTNIPGATYIGSPFVTLPDSVYLRYKSRIHRLDPATGKTLAQFLLPGPSVEVLYGENAPDWGHMSVQGDCLISTNEPHIFEDQALGWTESYSGTSSKRLVVMDRFQGQVLWERRAQIGFRHQAIISTAETLFVIDGISENALKHVARRGREPGEPSVVYAFDLKTGKQRWCTDSNVFGTFLLYSKEHDILIEGGSEDMRRRLEDEPRQITARRGRDGKILWEGGRFTLPATVRGEMLIPGRPGAARSILTGQEWGRPQPHADECCDWTYSKAYGCSTINASANLLLFRSGYAGFFDMEHDSGTGTFSGFKSGCTSNMIAADGVLNVLDYTRSCTCSYAHQTSLALVHMPDDSNIELWTRYDGSAPNPRGHDVNFGAPGRRVDGSGLVWYDQPGTHRRHPSAIQDNGGSIDWVAASGREASGTITVDSLTDTDYIVLLHFAELVGDMKPGRRVFDVFIDGRQVLGRYDIVARTGGPFRGTVEAVRVAVSGGRMDIELCKSQGAEFVPLINGIELIAQHVVSAR